MSIFSTLLLLLFSVPRVITDFAAVSKKIAGSLDMSLVVVDTVT